MNIASIILPCYNPPEHWAKNIVEQYRQLQAHISHQVEIILVQDGDSATVKEADISFLRTNIPHFIFVCYPENRGKGYAIKEGVKKATGNIIIYTDIDFPYTNNSILQIYEALDSNTCAIAVGIKNADYYREVALPRKLLSRFLKQLNKTFLSLPVTDTQCGLKGFKKEVAPLFLQNTINRYLFDLEFIRNSYKHNYKLVAIPVTLKEGVVFRKMNYRILLPEISNFIRLLFKS